MTSESDHGLAALEEMYKARQNSTDEGSATTLDLLHACYRISFKHRYDSAQEGALRQDIRRTVEAFIDETAKTGETE